MADYDFAGHSVDSGSSLMLPACGVWTADLVFVEPDAAVAEGQSGDLTVLGTARRGTVTSFSSADGFARARVVGGAGKLDVELGPQNWRGYLLGQIARQCVQEAGETAGAGWEGLTLPCAAWQRSQATLRECLRRVARQLSGEQRWRAARDGSLALATDAWADNSASADRERIQYPHERLVEWYPLDGTAEPGQSLTLFGAARRLLRVEYDLGAQVTCRGWY